MCIKTKLRNTKIFDIKVLAIHKIKTTLTLNRPEYFGMCM